MDRRLVAWARAVKARRRGRFPPPLWLFTDPVRTPDPAAAIAGLPPGLCGVVLRGHALQAPALRRLARFCRARRLPLAVADALVALPPGAGRHLRRGRGVRRGAAFFTSSAHGRAELVRARRAGADLVFLSPAFPTASHPGAPALGPLRWTRLASAAPAVLPLGGIDGRTVKRLPRRLAGAAAIGALLA